MPNKPTQVEVLEVLMAASQMAGHIVDASLEDTTKVCETVRTIDDAVKSLHKDNGGPLTSAQLMSFLATNLGYFIGCQVTKVSKIPLLATESIKIVITSALQTYQIVMRDKQ
jgi:hypothetical protein